MKVGRGIRGDGGDRVLVDGSVVTVGGSIERLAACTGVALESASELGNVVIHAANRNTAIYGKRRFTVRIL